jgi:4-hydroxythreonine-4-phosphate dehydrogenase
MSAEAPPPRPRLAITLGDPRGIGPEATHAALTDPEIAALADYTLIGPDALQMSARHYLGIGGWTRGDEASAGAAAGRAIEAGIRLALAGEVDALVTAPIDKHALRAAGYSFPGHTEMLQALSGAPAVGMLMAAERTLGAGPLRVLLATTHLALRDVPAALTAELFLTQTRLAHAALREWWRIERPRVALCAVNPHASDGGLFGDEEARILAPAIAALRREGIDAIGPVPADTVFSRAMRGEFDAVVAPYHDVGMAAFKTAAFGSGINVTLGLPFPRTSPDHGTALDIAGRGIADAGSMKEAIRLAARLAGRRLYTTAGPA